MDYCMMIMKMTTGRNKKKHLNPSIPSIPLFFPLFRAKRDENCGFFSPLFTHQLVHRDSRCCYADGKSKNRDFFLNYERSVGLYWTKWTWQGSLAGLAGLSLPLFFLEKLFWRRYNVCDTLIPTSRTFFLLLERRWVEVGK